MRAILFRYVLLDLIAPIILGLFLFTLVMISSQMLRAVNYVAEAQIPPTLIVEMFLSRFPQLLMVTVPMACLLGIMMAYGRLSEHNEVIGMLAGGVSYSYVMLPAVLLGITISVGFYFWSDCMIPRAFQLRNQLGDKVLNSITSIGIQEGVFIDDFPGLVFYTKNSYLEKNSDHPDSDERASVLSGTIIYQLNEEKDVHLMVISPTGETTFDSTSRMLQIKLSKGSVYTFDDEGAPSGYIGFDELDIQLDVQDIVRDLLGKDLDELDGKSRSEIHADMLEMESSERFDPNNKKYVAMAIEYHRRLALPTACGLICFVACPLGVLMGKGKRAILFLLSLGIITAYYFILTGGIDLAKQYEQVDPSLGVWLANIVLLLLGLLLNGWAARQR